ncbi:MAG: aminotransferase class V-fold PLP-dependent enzyme [Oceanicaulis sp.]
MVLDIAGVTSRADAEALDRADPLAGARQAFDIPDGVIYLDGNSLGPLPRAARDALHHAVETEWRTDLIKSWNSADWINLPLRAGDRIAALIGAPAGSVLAADSVSVNLFKLAAALVTKGAGLVAVERGDFPTDGYILEGLARLSGAGFSLIEPGAGVAGLPEEGGVLVRSAVHYKTAEIVDIEAEERAAREHGAAIIWDLSHAVGLVDTQLEACGATYAVGCGYKYLNGGPGAPGFVYVHPSVSGDLAQPLSGWMGHAAPFEFTDGYRAAEGIKRFAAGTPPILSMTALHAALSIYDGLDLAALQAKARALGDLFLARIAPLELACMSPGIGEARGGHVSVRHEDGYPIVQALIEQGIIGDFRAPDLMRFGFSPLILSYADVFDAAEALVETVRSGRYREARFSRKGAVT